jgi:hypothetical protein
MRAAAEAGAATAIDTVFGLAEFIDYVCNVPGFLIYSTLRLSSGGL